MAWEWDREVYLESKVVVNRHRKYYAIYVPHVVRKLLKRYGIDPFHATVRAYYVHVRARRGEAELRILLQPER